MGIYLDNASTTFPKPRAVAEAMSDYLLNEGCNINRGCYAGAYCVEEQVYETRQLLCDLFHGPDARMCCSRAFCGRATMYSFPRWSIMRSCAR